MLAEAIATIIVGFAIWFLLPDCESCVLSIFHNPCLHALVPDTAKWLSEKERAFVQARLPPNAPRANEQNFDWREIVASLKDIRLWLFTLIWAFFTVGTSGVRFYQSTVIADLGFTLVYHLRTANRRFVPYQQLTTLIGALLQLNF